MRQRARVDRNHAEIVQALRQLGCSVQSLARLGDGCPDLLVGCRGHNFLVEVKAPTKRERLTPDQQDWKATWRGSVFYVTSAEEAAELLLGVVT